jgi:hypothetical protein
MADLFYVIVIDIIGSSRLKDRDALTTQLNVAISRANKEYAHTCWAPFEVTKGDEVAGVLLSVATAYDIIDIFREALDPMLFRSVVVFDELDAGVHTRRSTVIDGPAFHRADQMMKRLKKTQKRFALSSGEKELDAAAEALVNFLLWRWTSLTTLQRKIVRLYQQGQKQSKVAEILNRKQQQIQNTLDVCKWQIIDEAEKALRRLLQVIDSRTRGSEGTTEHGGS